MPLRTVIAEDEFLIALQLRSQIESCGLEVVGTATTGAGAVELCRTHCPDVVFMDVQMPEMDGLEATRVLMVTCPTCVVVVTGRVQLDQVVEQAGGMGYAQKPLLREVVAELVTTARQRFSHFAAIRESATDGCEALATWRGVRQAVKVLMETDGLSEGDAHCELHRRASEGRVTLRVAADEVVTGPGRG
jgi:AmiR/NasT family two-component response regulator